MAPLIPIKAHLSTLQLVLPAAFQFDQISHGGAGADRLQDRYLVVARIATFQRDISPMPRCEIFAPAAKKAFSAGRHTNILFPCSRACQEVNSARRAQSLRPMRRHRLNVRKVQDQCREAGKWIFTKGPAKLDNRLWNAIATLNPRAIALAPINPEAACIFGQLGQQR